MIGHILGPYQVLSKIGEGGMGEIYRARDQRLDRVVAIKVLPAHVAGDPERRARFEREARMVSSLQHPHICVLHDVGSEPAAGDRPPIDYLVMEFLDGETLAERMRRKELTTREALAIAAQIADALAVAHKAGVVHRDLKPGNVMLVRDPAGGPPQAKLLDFGLAKPVGLAGTSGPLPAFSAAATTMAGPSPAPNSPITTAGTVLGTIQYMSPEQIQGQEADARSDLFAFGAMLREMLSGAPTFQGRTQLSLASAILEHDPAPLSGVPPALAQLVQACLAKHPDARCQSAHDLALQLRWIAGLPDQTAPAAAAPATGRRTALTWAAALVAAAGLATLVTWYVTATDPPAAPLAVATIDLDEAGYIAAASANLSISPDGHRIVYASTTGLFERRLDRPAPTTIAGADAGLMPFFSPDGRWIGFAAAGQLKKVPATGGPAAPICPLSGALGGATWGIGDEIVFSDGRQLFRVPASGGTAAILTTLADGELAHRWPSFLPDGRAVLFSVNTGATWSEARIEVVSLDTGERRTVLEGGTLPRYATSGHLLFTRARSLMVVRFDPASRTTSGAPESVLNDVAMFESDGRVHLALSDTGVLVYLPTSLDPKRTLVLVDRDGTTHPLPLEPRGYERPRFSPDGRRVALTIRETEIDIWILDLARRTLTRFTTELGEDESPVWSPDGLTIAYGGSRPGRPRDLVVRPADGSGAPEVLVSGEKHQHLGSWSPDGAVILTDEFGPSSFDLHVVSVKDRTTRPLVQSRYQEQGARLSPDGRWLAYASDETGRNEVYVVPFPGPGGKQRVSADGGGEPVWARSGRELFYRQGTRMMAVPLAPGPGFAPGDPRTLFDGQYTTLGWGEANYDVLPDGRRFLMIQGGDAPLPGLRLLLNWPAGLSRSAPAR